MATEQTKTEVKKVNQGDLALSHSLADDVKVDSAHIKNITHFKRTILPGHVVDKKKPSASYAFYWWRQPNPNASGSESEFAEMELEDLMEAGYDFVKEDKFEVKKWNKTADGRVRSGQYLLMYCTREAHEARLAERLRHLGNELDSRAAGFHGAADRLGLGTFEMRGGRERDVVKPSNKVDSLLD